MQPGLTSEKRCLRSSSWRGKKSTTGGGGGHLLGIRPKRKGFRPKTCCQFPLYPTSKGLLHTCHASPTEQTPHKHRTNATEAYRHTTQAADRTEGERAKLQKITGRHTVVHRGIEKLSETKREHTRATAIELSLCRTTPHTQGK